MNEAFSLRSDQLLQKGLSACSCSAFEPQSTIIQGVEMVRASRLPSCRSIRCFLTEEDGTSTVEFVILLPLFTILLLLVVDASMLFLRHTNLMNVSRDTARIVSRHAMSPAEAKTYAERNASSVQSRATADVTVAGGFVTVVITSDAASSAPFGIVAFAVGDVIVGRASSTMEPI